MHVYNIRFIIGRQSEEAKCTYRLSTNLPNVFSHEAQAQELSSKVVSLETELSRANDLLEAAKGRTLPLSDSEVLSLSPSLTRASAMLKSGSGKQSCQIHCTCTCT